MEKKHGEFAFVLRGRLKMNARKQRRICQRLPILNRKSQGGFILVFVIVAIIIIGIEMYVLAGMANTMQYQSHRVYLKACERNLIASGLAWTKQNIQKSSGVNPGQTIELDVNELDILGSALEVTLDSMDNQRQVRIRTSCRRGRQTINSNDTYKIE
jgi:hypothetical protein